MSNYINLDNFHLEKMDITNDEHLALIRKFDNDSLIKEYLYPYKDSFYDLVVNNYNSSSIFNSFFVIHYEERIIGYIEIEKQKDVFLNYAFLEDERKKGLASSFLKELSNYLLENYKNNVESVNGIIRNDNTASIHACKKAGFSLVKKEARFNTYRKNLVTSI